MNPIKYFKFYYNLTEKKIIWVIALALTSSLFQTLALSAIAAVSDYGGGDKKNTITRAAYTVFDYLAVTDQKLIFGILLFVAALSFSLMNLFLIFTNIYVIDLQNFLYRRIQNQLMNALMAVKFEYFASHSIGHFNNIAVKQLRTVSSSFKFFSDIIIFTIALVPFLLAPFIMNPLLALILGAVLAPLVWPLRLINHKTKAYSIKNVEEMTNLNSIMIQILHHYKYLKSTDNYRNVAGKMQAVIDSLIFIARRLIILSNLSANAILPVAISLICALVYWQVAVLGVSIVSAGLTLGFLYMAASRINVIPISYQKFISASGAILIYEQTIDELMVNAEMTEDSPTVQPDFSGLLEFKDFNFRYKGADSCALDKVTFTIPPNASVAFVGGSGAGKSTIVNALAGLLKPSSGSITLAGTDYNKINLSILRQGIGYVTQEPVIFSDSVANNISLWAPDATEEKIRKAAESAHAAEFIEKMPDGYNSMLGDNGVNLSGGQRQRISIAREFYRETPVLILDEATSALDSETEQIIQQSIKELHGKKTLIIIAHRLSTIKECDVIFVLNKGKIVEKGSYAELLAKNAIFKEMVEKQSL